LNALKPTLVDRYDEWLRQHPYGFFEHEHPDIAARAQALREKFQAQEREMQEMKWKLEQRQAQHDMERRARTKVVALAAVLEAQDAAPTHFPDSMFSAAEAVKRKWQQQQLQAQVDMEETQRNAPTNAPDYTFSRKHTIVVSDAFPPEEANRYHSPSGSTRCGAIAFLLLALVW
jgi:hypothetical protein